MKRILGWWWELKIWKEGSLKEVRFVIMFLDEVSIKGEGVTVLSGVCVDGG